jgi:two-component system CheB/CheR fusion protein
VTITVEHLETGEQQARRYAVILQDSNTGPERGHGHVAGAPGELPEEQHARVERLEAELQLIRDRLQSTIEELESTNEELKSSNEEYQSVNEELQSANEELETSKEELQSLNEELQTVNGELAHRVEELGRANSDLKNLFESTQIATVFLDNDLRVKTFTPAITDVINLIDGDIGRPLSHIALQIEYEDLIDDARKVLRTLSTIERQSQNPKTGARYLTRVLPYRSVENVIEGVVLTFLDITRLSRAEERLRASEGRLRSLVENMPQLVWRANTEGHLTWSSPQWTAFTGQGGSEAVGAGWLQVIHPDDRDIVMNAWKNASAGHGMAVDHRLWYALQNDYRNVHTRAVQLRDEAGSFVEWLGTSTDVHELLLMQQRQKILLAELQHRVRNSLSVIRSITKRSAATSESVADYAKNVGGRIDAFARAQAILTRAPDAVVDLKGLVLDELESYAFKGQAQAHVHGPDVMLKGKAAEDLSLVFHELTTNSVKHGALANEGGRVFVTWKSDDTTAAALHLRWQEETTSPIKAPSRRGFGSELIEKLVPHELQGTGRLEFAENGMLCTIELPLSESVRLGSNGLAPPIA